MVHVHHPIEKSDVIVSISIKFDLLQVCVLTAAVQFQWLSKLFLRAWVRACMGACVHGCVHAWVGACVHEHVRVCVYELFDNTRH